MDQAAREPILFHEPSDEPYGVFSAFAPTPIWIAGRRYATVEHWYQAMRGMDEDHEWIRRAPTPHEAKRRAAEIQPRRYWIEQRVFIMYRGMLAKFRQHPELAQLLLDTGDLEIHERCTEPFWGDDGADGQDWLGAVLQHVRGRLRSPDFSGPLSQLVPERFHNYETASAVRSARDQGTAWFVHLVRYRDSGDPREVLRAIIKDGCIRSSRQLNSYMAVCFSAGPIRNLEAKVFEEEAMLRRQGAAYRYSPFGIALDFQFGRELGIRPVLPLPNDDAATLPPHLRFLSQPYSPGDWFDYTHEDEWRAPFDVSIREGPFALVLPKGRTLSLVRLDDAVREDSMGTLESIKRLNLF